MLAMRSARAWLCACSLGDRRRRCIERREQREQRLSVLLAESGPDPPDREQLLDAVRSLAQERAQHRIRGDGERRLALGALHAPRAQLLELVLVDRLARVLLVQRCTRAAGSARAARAALPDERCEQRLLERAVGVAHVTASTARLSERTVAEVIEDLAPAARLPVRAIALDRAVGLPAAVARRLDRRVRHARAAAARQRHLQTIVAARAQLQRARALGDRQQHPLALAQLAVTDRQQPALGDAAQACDITLDVLDGHLALLDEPDQPAQVHP